MTIKILTATLFLLGMTATALAGPVTAQLTTGTPPVVQVKKGDSIKEDEAYSTVAHHKKHAHATVKKHVKSASKHSTVQAS